MSCAAFPALYRFPPCAPRCARRRRTRPFAPAAFQLPWHPARLAIPLAGCFAQLSRPFTAFSAPSSLRTAPPHPPLCSLCSRRLPAPSAPRAPRHTSCLVSRPACPAIFRVIGSPYAPRIPFEMPLNSQRFSRNMVVFIFSYSPSTPSLTPGTYSAAMNRIMLTR
ncbi:hypothetical protein DFH06DRAFT_708049 [Mycena polygramma]|nr:hypothetical protein DFH06DRAFT_708049 [Mycena polygramma]